MKAIISFTYDSCLVYIPDKLAGDDTALKSLSQQFDKWLYDKNNDHGLWIFEDGEKYAVSFDTNDFIDWINQEHLRRSADKAQILDENYTGNHGKYPELYF